MPVVEQGAQTHWPDPAAVEDQLRTYMLAGVEPEELENLPPNTWLAGDPKPGDEFATSVGSSAEAGNIATGKTVTFLVPDQPFNSGRGWKATYEYHQPLTEAELAAAMEIFESRNDPHDGVGGGLSLSDIQSALPVAVAALVRVRADANA